MPNWNDLGFYDEGLDLAAPEFYASATRTSEQPTILPPVAFRSLSFSVLEDEAVWSRDWVCVGSVDDIPGEGDLLPFTVGNHGVHVQRMADGLEARFNKAQHGGCRAIPLQCQTGTKTKCSFTSCGYSRDRRAIPAGELGAATPAMHQYLGLRPERLLRPALRTLGSAIFVNLNPGAEWPEEDLSRAPMLSQLPNMPRSHEIWQEYQANWKVMASALIDGETIHEATANWIAMMPVFHGETLVNAAWLFPNLVLLGDGVHTAVIVLQSTAIGQTLCRISVRGPDAEITLPRWLELISARAARAEAVHADIANFDSQRRPETLGQPLPPQKSAAALWMQTTLADRVARVPAGQSPHARVANF